MPKKRKGDLKKTNRIPDPTEIFLVAIVVATGTNPAIVIVTAVMKRGRNTKMGAVLNHLILDLLGSDRI